MTVTDVNVVKMHDKNLNPSESSKIVPVYMDKLGCE